MTTPNPILLGKREDTTRTLSGLPAHASSDSADATDINRYVFVTVPRCPICGSSKHTTQRTERHDGNRCQRKLCRGCGWRFLLVWEEAEDSE